MEVFWSGILWKDRILTKRRVPSPQGATTKFTENSMVETTEDGVNIRDAVADWKRKPATTVAGTKDYVLTLPMYFAENWYWQVDLESGATGWVAEQYLRVVTIYQPDPNEGVEAFVTNVYVSISFQY